jgi:hypothetical protein
MLWLRDFPSAWKHLLEVKGEYGGYSKAGQVSDGNADLNAFQ